MANEITINPAQLVGKLHSAAAVTTHKAVSGEFNIVNSAINVNDKNDPKSVLKDGKFEIKFQFSGDKEARNKVEEIVRTYLDNFAGRDISSQVMKNGDFKAQVSAVKDGKADELVVPYSNKIESGKKQSPAEQEKQQKQLQRDKQAEQNIIDIDAEIKNAEDKEAAASKKAIEKASDSEKSELATALAKSSDIPESNPIVVAAKDPNKVSSEQFSKKLIDALSDISDKPKEMNEQKMILTLQALKNFADHYREEDVELKETDGKPGTAAEIWNKYEKYLNSAYSGLSNAAKKTKNKLKDVIKRFADVKSSWKNIGHFSPNLFRQFSHDVYKWSENAIKKAKEDFSGYFVPKTEKDKDAEEKATHDKSKAKIDLRDLRKQVEDLKEFWPNENSGEGKSTSFDSISKLDNRIKTYNKEETSDLPPSLTIKELLRKNPGEKTLKLLLAMSKGNFLFGSNNKECKLNDLLKINIGNILSYFENFPPELFAYLPKEVRDHVMKVLALNNEKDDKVKKACFKGKITESASYFTFTSDMLLEGKSRLSYNRLIIEHRQKMLKQTEKLIRQIVSNKNVEAQATLESILKKKSKMRIKSVLEEEKANS